MMQNRGLEDGLHKICEAVGLDLDEVYEKCKEFGVDLEVPAESEEYFKALITRFAGERQEDFAFWLRANLSRDLISSSGRPVWIQGAEWPFQAGLPMIFAGQLDVKASVSGGYFHDDASIYVFLPREGMGEVATITQLY